MALELGDLGEWIGLVSLRRQGVYSMKVGDAHERFGSGSALDDSLQYLYRFKKDSYVVLKARKRV